MALKTKNSTHNSALKDSHFASHVDIELKHLSSTTSIKYQVFLCINHVIIINTFLLKLRSLSFTEQIVTL